jgi:hypothetical protein
MTKPNLIQIGRWLGRGLLLLCLILPLSQCTRKQVLSFGGKIQINAQAISRLEVLYPSDYMDFSKFGGYAVFTAYTWPVLVGFILIKVKKTWFRLAILVGEVLLCSWSGWLIYVLGSFGRRLIGGYLALFALSVYLLATVVEIWSACRKIKTERIPTLDMNSNAARCISCAADAACKSKNITHNKTQPDEIN